MAINKRSHLDRRPSASEQQEQKVPDHRPLTLSLGYPIIPFNLAAPKPNKIVQDERGSRIQGPIVMITLLRDRPKASCHDQATTGQVADD